jgi:hypothetical protein
MTRIIEIMGQIADAAPAVDKNNGMKNWQGYLS